MLPSLVTAGDYLGRLTAAAELRPGAARAVASAVAGVTTCGSFKVCGQLRTSTVRAQGDACRLRECRCSEALAEPLARLAQSAG